MNTIKKQKWKAGNMIYPLPAAMVSCGDREHTNIVTVGWTGTICTNPAMTYISLRKSRFSYNIIKESGYFVINLTTRDLAFATDYCGVKSGRDVDKFKEMSLTPIWDEDTNCPMIGESPVSIICEVTEIKELGSHDMFIAKVLNVYVNKAFMDEKGKFHLNDSDLIAYSHGTYLTLGEPLGTFGYSICKKADKKGKESKKAPKEVVSQKTKLDNKKSAAKVPAKHKSKKTTHKQTKQAKKSVSKPFVFKGKSRKKTNS